MSKSYKKAIIKDHGFGGKTYRKAIRGSQNNYIRSNMDKLINDEDFEIPDGKTIINDYTYCDYKLDYEHKSRKSRHYTQEEIEEDKKRNRRK